MRVPNVIRQSWCRCRCVKRADAVSLSENRGREALIRTSVKGTCSVKSIRPRKRKSQQLKRRVRIGAPNPTVTGLAGLVTVEELTARLGLFNELDRGIGQIKERDRGLAGEAPQVPRRFYAGCGSGLRVA